MHWDLLLQTDVPGCCNKIPTPTAMEMRLFKGQSYSPRRVSQFQPAQGWGSTWQMRWQSEQGHHHNGEQATRWPHILCSICVHSFAAFATAVGLFMASLSRNFSLDIFVHLQQFSSNLKAGLFGPNSGERCSVGISPIESARGFQLSVGKFGRKSQTENFGRFCRNFLQANSARIS